MILGGEVMETSKKVVLESVQKVEVLDWIFILLIVENSDIKQQTIKVWRVSSLFVELVSGYPSKTATPRTTIVLDSHSETSIPLSPISELLSTSK